MDQLKKVIEEQIVFKITKNLDDKIDRLRRGTNATYSMSTFEIVDFVMKQYKGELARNKELGV